MLFRTWLKAGIGRWKDPVIDAGGHDRVVADSKECHRGDGEQDNGRRANKTEENEMEEQARRSRPSIASADDCGSIGIAF